ncbi:MAG: TetR/AcrR family transcriptional regulator [Actinobacteria bacterium]|nr:TetR/AcrR family transcriptional regulator [Actinomycetota bacterium]
MTGSDDTDQPGDLGHDDMPSRILDAAARVFYRDGIWATGVDALASEAGVSKRTLYNHFGSKDGVIAAYLRQRESYWQAKLDALWEEMGDDPVERVVANVRAYARPVEPETFRGSAFINAAAELADEHSEALGVIQHSLDRMESGIAAILAEAGYAGADKLARRVLYLLEGAVVVGGARRDASALDDAEKMIRELLAQHAP